MAILILGYGGKLQVHILNVGKWDAIQDHDLVFTLCRCLHFPLDRQVPLYILKSV